MPFIRNKNGIKINTLRSLPQVRYIAALVRIKEQIKNGSELEAEDSDTIGDKYTHCNWGLCSGSVTQWPDKEDRLFPRDYPLAILHRTKGQDCPMDEKKGRKYGPDGCFYSCRVFQHPNNPPTREEAIELYDIQIKKVTNGNQRTS